MTFILNLAIVTSEAGRKSKFVLKRANNDAHCALKYREQGQRVGKGRRERRRRRDRREKIEPNDKLERVGTAR